MLRNYLRIRRPAKSTGGEIGPTSEAGGQRSGETVCTCACVRGVVRRMNAEAFEICFAQRAKRGVRARAANAL